MNKQIEKAVTVLGGQTSTARVLSERTGAKITQGNIWSWMHRTETVPSHVAPYFEALTEEKGQRVSKESLCPDFPWNMCCPEGCQKEATA